MDDWRPRVLRLEADVLNHDVRLKKVEREFTAHGDHHLEIATFMNESRRQREEKKLDDEAMKQSIEGIVARAAAHNTSRIDGANLLQAIVLVLVAAIYIAGEKLGLGLAAIGGAEAAVLALAAWFVRRGKASGRIKKDGTGLSHFPPTHKNGGSP